MRLGLFIAFITHGAPVRIVLVILLLLATIASPQDLHVEQRGWSQIKFISIHYSPSMISPILSGSDAERIVKAIGYKILPVGIKLGGPNYDALEEDSILSIELHISLIALTTDGERYFGSMSISLESPVPIPFLYKREVTDAPEISLREWKPYTENAILLRKYDLIYLQKQDSVMDMFRERVRELFEDLTIKMREHP